MTEQEAYTLIDEDSTEQAESGISKNYAKMFVMQDEAWIVSKQGFIIGNLDNFLKLLGEIWPKN